MGDRFQESQQQLIEDQSQQQESFRAKKSIAAQFPKATSMDDFEITSKLGDGAYSSVYKCRRIADGEIYALKKVKLHHLSEKEKENAINEVRILASLKHNNIISYKESFIEPQTQSLCIVMEYADNGDLFQQITDHQKNKTCFNENEIWKVFIQVVRGLKTMHDLNIMHRDLKSANVFLCKDFTAKLGDMNVSKVANKRGLNYTQTGTPYYASPEVWKDEPYDVKSDIWSLGCVLYEMIALKPPFTSDDMQGLFKKVTKGHFPRIPKNYSHDLWTMVKYLIQVNPSARPNCDQIMNIPTFAKRFEKLFPDEQLFGEQNILLKTIKFPKNLMYLSDRLPKQNYTNYKDSMNDDFSQMMDSKATLKKNQGGNTQGGNKNQQQKDLKLPSIQNVKQIYQQQQSPQKSQQQLHNNVEVNYLSAQDDNLGVNSNSMILAGSPRSKKKVSGAQNTVRPFLKPRAQKSEDKVNNSMNSGVSNTLNQSIISQNEDDKGQSLNIDSEQIDINANNQSIIGSMKKKSIQHYTSLEVLNEENQSKLTEMNEQISDNINQGLILVASEKRIKIQGMERNGMRNDSMLPPLGHDEIFHRYKLSNVSPLLAKSKAQKNLKQNHHQVSISQDYSQKKILSNQLSLNSGNNLANVQRITGAYQVNPNRIANYQKQTGSPHQLPIMHSENSESQDRLRASPQRIQEILNRYNIKQLKQNLKNGIARGAKNNRIQNGKYQVNQSYLVQKGDYSTSLLHSNNSSVDLAIDNNIDQNSKAKEKSFSKAIISEEVSIEGADNPQAQSTINTMKNNLHKIQQYQNQGNGLHSVHNSSIVLPKLDNSFSNRHQQYVDQLAPLYKNPSQNANQHNNNSNSSIGNQLSPRSNNNNNNSHNNNNSSSIQNMNSYDAKRGQQQSITNINRGLMKNKSNYEGPTE